MESSRTAGSQNLRSHLLRTAGGSFKRLTIALGRGFFVTILRYSCTFRTRACKNSGQPHTNRFDASYGESRSLWRKNYSAVPVRKKSAQRKGECYQVQLK